MLKFKEEFKHILICAKVSQRNIYIYMYLYTCFYFYVFMSIENKLFSFNCTFYNFIIKTISSDSLNNTEIIIALGHQKH